MAAPNISKITIPDTPPSGRRLMKLPLVIAARLMGRVNN
jgi:hypothetical protein